jgi:hypothetical protein
MYPHQFISKGLVFARIAGSTHLTSLISPVFMSLTIFLGKSTFVSNEVGTVLASCGDDVSLNGGVVVVKDVLSFSALNMCRLSIVVLFMPNGCGANADETAKSAKTQKTRLYMVTSICSNGDKHSKERHDCLCTEDCCNTNTKC